MPGMKLSRRFIVFLVVWGIIVVAVAFMAQAEWFVNTIGGWG